MEKLDFVSDEMEKLDFVSKTEALRRLAALEDTEDTAWGHEAADEVLLEVLCTLGQTDIVKAYQRTRRNVGFWYS
jgi:hypothetical protein